MILQLVFSLIIFSSSSRKFLLLFFRARIFLLFFGFNAGTNEYVIYRLFYSPSTTAVYRIIIYTITGGLGAMDLQTARFLCIHLLLDQTYNIYRIVEVARRLTLLPYSSSGTFIHRVKTIFLLLCYV